MPASIIIKIDGVDADDESGIAVSNAGDVNGDGIDDIIIGARGSDPGGDSRAGEAYVVFGSKSGFGSSIDLATLDGSNGFRLDGIDADDLSGAAVSAAGDVNGDGIDDIIIGAPDADPDGMGQAGESYVVFGSNAGFGASLDLGSLDGSNGFRVTGTDGADRSGASVSGVGDVNGDGVDDFIVSALRASPGFIDRSGANYVIFGSTTGFPASFDPDTLNGSNGFRLDGVDPRDFSGQSVSGAGDVNGDGFDDIIIGTSFADPDGKISAGESYVVFGSDTGFNASLDLSRLNGSNGFRIDGIDTGDASGRSVSSAGDVNGDGFDDIIIGASSGDPDGSNNAGESYIVFGSGSGFSASLDLDSLDGSNGFRIDGIDPWDASGASVSGVGDVNGDGIDDFLIGAPTSDPGGASAAGESYLVFGSDTGFSASLDLSSLDGSTGYRIDGIDPDDFGGTSVSGAGDVNGDGIDDILIGAPQADPGGDSNAGETFLILGGGNYLASLDAADGHVDGVIDLEPAQGTTSYAGLVIEGIDAGDASGITVSSAGDVNGDGIGDIVIGAFRGDPSGNSDAGESYLVFGSNTGFSASFDLSTLNGSNGFRLDGIDADDRSGLRVSAAGDINGDGFDDIIIAARDADPGGKSASGESYVVFGSNTGFSASFDLSTLNGNNGFRLEGIDAFDQSGFSVAAAGDVDGDGIDDIIIGALLADPSGIRNAGESYVVFGSSAGFSASLDLATLDGSNGFRLDGADEEDRSGRSVASAGDINGDGIDDIIIGARDAEPSGKNASGESYVVFGSNTGFSASFDLSTLNGSNGFRLDGIDSGDLSGGSVASAGDVNGDGIDDIIIGAAGADPNGEFSAGESYVVFGSNAGFSASLDLSTLDGSNGFRLDGINSGDESGVSVASAGDVNGDGIDDIIIGAQDGDPGRNSNAGETYVVFGSSAGFSASLDLSTLNGRNGFRLDGIDGADFSGGSVASAGDLNGDGFDDIVISARGADPNGNSSAGETYVVFGGAANLASLDAADGVEDGAIALSNLGIAYQQQAVCFAKGTWIACPGGPRRIEELRCGDMVETADHGPQPLRWIGQRQVSPAELALYPKLRPIRIEKGALGRNLPQEPLVVSRQHRVLADTPIVRRMTGCDEALIAAHHLVGLPGVETIETDVGVQYFHLLFDRHEVVWANGAPAESLHLGREAGNAISPEGRAEIAMIFPDAFDACVAPAPTARSLMQHRRAKTLVARMIKNRRTPLRASRAAGVS